METTKSYYQFDSNSKVFEILRGGNILYTDIITDTFDSNVIAYTANVDATKAFYVDITYQTKGNQEIEQSFVVIEDNQETIKEVITDSQYYNRKTEDELTSQEIEQIANDKIEFGHFIGSRNEEGEYHTSVVGDTQYRIYEVY